MQIVAIAGMLVVALAALLSWRRRRIRRRLARGLRLYATAALAIL